MKMMTLLFCIFHFFMNIISCNPTEPILIKYILDLSEIQPGTLVHSYSYGGVEYSSYRPNFDGKFVKVTDGDIDLWDSAGGGTCLEAWTHTLDNCTLLRLVITLLDGINRFFFVEKVNGTWNQVDSAYYANKIEAMLKNSSDSVMIDVGNPDYTTCEVIRFSKYNISNFVGYPLASFKPRRLMYNNFLIWESDDYYCTHFALAVADQKAIAEIHIEDDNKLPVKLYFSFFGTGWIRASRDEFLIWNSMIIAEVTKKDMKKQRYMPIDIDGRVDSKNALVSMYRLDMTPVIDIKPSPKLIVNAITSMNEPIWKAGEDERCLNVKKIICPNGLSIIALTIKDFTGYQRKYFQRRDFYEPMSEEEYNAQVSLISNSGIKKDS
ncbi:signal peptide-containing protein [Theileria equi strain WA]|uniref:Signal peptide-containing protein n=1 Tax=Theileria equi strain WA TaxID=1537102 RepID=L0B194_THEEQ|nr:signal peptide-containing protein [Theileria equi strain WA]AFZ80879.1 signal peptide-containing protein [Theileria equi strain WA]|eukprot:XP_004830545.1 signal peptide-containing protein [Theileria equi strain WA]